MWVAILEIVGAPNAANAGVTPAINKNEENRDTYFQFRIPLKTHPFPTLVLRGKGEANESIAREYAMRGEIEGLALGLT